MDMLNTCMKKAKFNLIDDLRSEDEASALTFGSAIHKALEHWYTLPFEDRELSPHLHERAELLGYGHDLQKELTGPLESIRQFVLRADSLKQLGEEDKRSVSNGIKILKAYFKHYATDGLEVYRDELGPVIERPVSFILHEDEQYVIEYFGTIDVVLTNKQLGVIYIADHKTTAQLGAQFYARLKPNHQYTGYIIGAQRCLNINTNLFMINAVQVAKTKQEFARQTTTRDDDDFAEFKTAVLMTVKNYLYALESGIWQMNTPNPCSSYGSCAYLDVCAAPKKLHANIIKAKWGKENELHTNGNTAIHAFADQSNRSNENSSSS